MRSRSTSDPELARLEALEAHRHAQLLRINRTTFDSGVLRAARELWQEAVDAVHAYKRAH
jgi:hypothetical protein